GTFRARLDTATGAPDFVFVGVLAAPVAQTWSLLYRRFLPATLPGVSDVLPVGNRRYGSLTICATVNRYPDSSSGRWAPGASDCRSVDRRSGCPDSAPWW